MRNLGKWLIGIGFALGLFSLVNFGAIQSDIAAMKSIAQGNASAMSICEIKRTCNGTNQDSNSDELTSVIWMSSAVLGVLIATSGTMITLVSMRSPQKNVAERISPDAAKSIKHLTVFCVNCGEQLVGIFCSRCGSHRVI